MGRFIVNNAGARGTFNFIFLPLLVKELVADAAADADHAFIELVAAADLAKWAYFENATFVNCGAAMDQLPDVLTVSATMAGIMFFNGVTVVGALDLADNEEKVYVKRIGLDTTEGKFMVQAILTDVT